MSKVLKMGAAVALVGIIGAGGYFLYWTSTPRYTLYRTALAIQSRDRAHFDRLVDSERVLESLGDDILTSISNRLTDPAHARFPQLAERIKGWVVQSVKPHLRTLLQSSLDNYFAGKEQPQDVESEPAQIVGGITAAALFSRLVRIGKEEIHGDEAILTLVLSYQEKNYELDILLNKSPTGWKIVRLGKVPEMVQTFYNPSKNREVSSHPTPTEGAKPPENPARRGFRRRPLHLNGQ